MSCCFSPHILTRAERDAIARLREKRAAGKAPVAAAHRAQHHSHQDPIVTFYHKLPSPKPPPRRPRPQHRPTNPTVTARKPVKNAQPKTAHQQKKHARQAAKRERVGNADAEQRTPPVRVLVDKVRNANMFQRAAQDTAAQDTAAQDTAAQDTAAQYTATQDTAPQGTSSDKENSVNKFMAATKKRFDHVKHRFGNQSPVGERFVLQQSPNADASESNNDHYFQELMKSDA